MKIVNLKFITLFFLIILISCAKDGANKKEYSDPTICTRDLNQWGHSSNCKCKGSNELYDQKKGKCYSE
jgi:hypothetical protein